MEKDPVYRFQIIMKPGDTETLDELFRECRARSRAEAMRDAAKIYLAALRGGYRDWCKQQLGKDR